MELSPRWITLWDLLRISWQCLQEERKTKNSCSLTSFLWLLPKVGAVFQLWGAHAVPLTQTQLKTSVKSIYWFVFAHLEKQTPEWILNNEKFGVLFPLFYFVQILKGHILAWVTSRRLRLWSINQQRVWPAEFTFCLKSIQNIKSLLSFFVFFLS